MSGPIVMFAQAALTAMLLCACGRIERTEPGRETAAPERTSASGVALPPAAAVAPSAARSTPAAAPWPPAEMLDPDPRMRRFALEQWARGPTEALDLVAAALVDPEESIRERAEQVFEEALARRR
jgi:hypothetical protein